MKKFVSTLFLFVVCVITTFNAFSQSSIYGAKQIGKWHLEKFPISYYKPAFKTVTEKAPFVGKVALYQEVNQYGQNDGLRVEMQTDYISPHTIYYYKNGVVVYTAHYFANSKIAYEIINKNLNDQFDGPQITRTLTNNTVQEIVDIYKNGELIKTNRPDNAPVINFVNGLLEGKFKYEYNNSTYEGTASNGELSYFKKNNYGDMWEYKIIGDEIKFTVLTGSAAGEKESYHIESHLKITNDKSLADKDDKYIFWGNGLDLGVNEIGKTIHTGSNLKENQ